MPKSVEYSLLILKFASVLTDLSRRLKHRLTVHTIGIGGESMKWLEFLAKAARGKCLTGVIFLFRTQELHYLKELRRI
jgi:hypothetical protein